MLLVIGSEETKMNKDKIRAGFAVLGGTFLLAVIDRGVFKGIIPFPYNIIVYSIAPFVGVVLIYYGFRKED
jgi:uncharacterized membrane protein